MRRRKNGLALPALLVYKLYTMSFTRKITKNGKVYLAEVESRWIDGKCVQKHIRYVGKQADGRTILSASLSDAVVDEVKLYGPLLLLDHLAKKIGLPELLGERGREILSMVYAHCLDYKSVNQMERWFQRTDLSMLLPLAGVTEQKLLEALDTLEALDAPRVQQRIFERVRRVYKLPVSGIIYDVTNTYLYGKRCLLGKPGHDKEGVKGRPLIQVGLAVTKDTGIPVCHKVMDGNIHDARMFRDFVTDLRSFSIGKGLLVYDRGISSAQNLKDARAIGWDTLCGLPLKGDLPRVLRSLIAEERFVRLDNRVRLRKGVFYAIAIAHAIDGVRGVLAVCFNEQQQRELRESRYDEIDHARGLLARGQAIKSGLEKFFNKAGALRQDVLAQAEEFDGYTCLFSTARLRKENMVQVYFEKDLVEKAFRSLKGIVRLQPVRHWLYNRVTAHVFICYLAYLLLALLQHQLKSIGISAEEALLELETMYKVYLRDSRRDFRLSRVVTMTKKQEAILKTIDRKLVKS
jgi:transposase